MASSDFLRCRHALTLDLGETNMMESAKKMFHTARAAWAHDKKRTRVKRKADELAFLPAALEVLETPASPAGRLTLYVIISIFLLALVWGCLGRVDTVAVAPGKIIPGGRVKVVQPLEMGLIRAIHVKEGDHVKKGDALIDLDPTENRVDKARVERAIASLAMKYGRLETTLRRLDGETSAVLKRVAGIDDKTFWDSGKKMETDLADIRSRLAALENDRRALAAERRAVSAEMEKIQAVLPIFEQKEKAMRSLYESGSGTKFEWLEARREWIQKSQDLVSKRHMAAGISARLASNRESRKQARSDFRKGVFAERLQALEDMEQSRLELNRAETREKLNRLTAPVDGKVQNLKVHTVGGVVEPAEPLMTIVPDRTPMEIEAMALNRDIGFIREGQSVEIKVESFPFSKYGLVKGRVARISPDALETGEMGLVYPIAVSMDEDRIQVRDKWVSLCLGMAVTAEIKTDDRRIIEYFLSPLLRYQSEALRER
ncbi:Hemolysin secretion protein D [Candidatus Desulfarcum epimagneticum]|uniref:Hemolysin secretion protein D n=1 Tax=uncultured Desulfobacteraceae bacterium TaxID=218296 RepID=A0A484HFP1_9BACT|nr:Hemolysin secretion protein D [uncultured Desulfobacteraceae bacterium]